jgi:pilus assembly protein CpaF
VTASSLRSTDQVCASKNNMALRERLIRETVGGPGTGNGNGNGNGQDGTVQHSFQEMKARLHRTLINRMDLTKLAALSQEQVHAEVSRLAETVLAQEAMPLSTADRDRLVNDVQHELFGLGPLEPLLGDPTISDILVNSHGTIYVERRGKLEVTNVTFKDDEHLMRVIERIVSSVGRRIDESSPMVDARLRDGSRVNAIIPPLSIDGPVLSIRRFGAEPLRMNALIENKALTRDIADMLQMCVHARLNVLISGGTGAGKTTLLNALSAYIPEDERIVTIEDSAELQLQQPHVVRLETRPPNIENRGEVTQRDLVRNSLRMRPDRIVIGEVRGGEAIDMLQAMNTGHDGSLTTIHANTPRDALARLETMIQMTGMRLSDRAMRQQIAAAINLVLQVARLSDGTRRVTAISEITGMEGETITMQEIFLYERTGVDSQGQVIGRFRPTGIRPRFAERLKASGLQLPRVFFEEM